MSDNTKNATEEVIETEEVTSTVEPTLDEECEGIPELQESNGVATREVILKFAKKNTVLKIPQEQYEELLKAKLALDITLKLHEEYSSSYDFDRLFKALMAVCYPGAIKDGKGGK